MSVDAREQIVAESGVIGWDELARHFARGVVVRVAPSLDLVDAAECLASDDTEQLARWLTRGELARASDDDARDWTRRLPSFRCVVAAPWVLVQER